MRRRRELLGLSQAQLADRCGVTQQSISRIEAGRSLPRDDLKLALAAQLGCSPRTLFPWPPPAQGALGDR